MKRNKNLYPAVSYDEGLIERLKNPEYVVVYLNTILKQTDRGMRERFLTAMSLVAKAYGLSKLSSFTNLQRESLRKALSEKGNPTLSTLFSLLNAFGLGIRLEVSSKPVSQPNTQPEPEISLDISERLNKIITDKVVEIVSALGTNEKKVAITQPAVKNETLTSSSETTVFRSLSGKNNYVH